MQWLWWATEDETVEQQIQEEEIVATPTASADKSTSLSGGTTLPSHSPPPSELPSVANPSILLDLPETVSSFEVTIGEEEENDEFVKENFALEVTKECVDTDEEMSWIGEYCTEYGCKPGGCSTLSDVGDWIYKNQGELLAGLVTAVAVVPTSIAFAFLGNIDPQVGLMGSWIIGLILALFGGCPAMIYCNAGAIAIVLGPLVDKEGVEHVFYAFILAGIITIFLGMLGIHNLLRLLPASAMIGFVDGLAILIFFGQFKNFQIDCEDDDHRRLSGGGLGSFEVLRHECGWITGGELGCMLINIIFTMTIVYFHPSMANHDGMKQYLRKYSIYAPVGCTQHLEKYLIIVCRIFVTLPAALVGVMFSMLIEHGIVRSLSKYETNLVGDIAEVKFSAPVPIFLQDDMPALNSETLMANQALVLQTALKITAGAIS